MKRTISLLCAGILCIGLLTAFTGCGKADDSETEAGTSNSGVTTEYDVQQDDNIVEDPF